MSPYGFGCFTLSVQVQDELGRSVGRKGEIRSALENRGFLQQEGF